MPHKMAGTAPRGLSAEGVDLCFNCHNKGDYSGKKSVHVPVASGMCTVCHDPHSSGSASLLLSDNICLDCHAMAKLEGKSVHPPVSDGLCVSCHNPHQSENDRLLQKEVPDSCFLCHDKTRFYGPTIHAPVGIGMCGACHTHHESENEKLLTSDITEICYDCHDKSDYKRKFVHKPVMEGQCGKCHYSHASQNRALLFRRGNLLCRKCHPDIERKPHAVSGFRAQGHPVRGRKDPNRPGRTFGCLSCHLPHSSDSLLLFRYKAMDSFDLCVNCHDM
jgi:predicted CXXCH cytochrome family protein